jgi:hypothetical protein
LQYFNDKFSQSGELGGSVAAFKAARLVWPQKMVEMQPTSIDIDELQTFPFLNESSVLENLKKELSVYLTKAADLDRNIDPVQWWKDHTDDLPCWSAAAAKILLVQLQRNEFFSLLQNSFGSFQDAALTDYLQASIMLQYNKR